MWLFLFFYYLVEEFGLMLFFVIVCVIVNKDGYRFII